MDTKTIERALWYILDELREIRHDLKPGTKEYDYIRDLQAKIYSILGDLPF